MIKKIKQKFKDKNSLNFDDWYQQATKYFLTIQDIQKMKHNEKTEYLMLDRNVLDIAYEINKKNKPYTPKYFFRQNKMTYTHKNELEGVFKQIYFNYVKDKKTKKIKKISDIIEHDFWFEIEYKKEKWYPLYDGYLPAKDLQGFLELLGKKKHWTEFSNKTHIGWRGPFIKWTDLNKLQNIHFEADLE